MIGLICNLQPKDFIKIKAGRSIASVKTGEESPGNAGYHPS